MLKTILRTTGVQWFKRYLKLAFTTAILGVPIIIIVNASYFLSEDYVDAGEGALLFILWSLYTPYLIACTSHLVAFFYFSVTAHCFQMSMFTERLNFERANDPKINLRDQSRTNFQWCSSAAFMEEYLFHQIVLRRSSTLWETVLVITLFYSSAIFILGVIGLIYEGNYLNLGYTVLGGVTLLSIAGILRMLKAGSPENWINLKGSGSSGRQYLLEYVQSNPIEFTLFGLTITWGFYLAVTGAMGSSLIAAYYVIVDAV